MDINKYLKRLNFTNDVSADDATLVQLHEQHVLNVPFENLDIHFHRPFDLEINNLFKKVIDHSRGGFCYELNTLFNALLCSIGFESRIIEARIYDELGNLGPKYDHMAIFVQTDKPYLLDVGFGDLFIRPLEIKDGIQSDGKNHFKIERLDESDFLLSMSSDQTNFHRKYTFNLNVVQHNDFQDICVDKQTNPLSYFVKNTVCTKPTRHGRITVFNNRFIERKGNEKIEQLITDEDDLRAILKAHFGIKMS